MVVCSSCGGDDVEEKSWTKPNSNNEYVESCGEEDGYCRDCEGTDIQLEDKEQWDNDNRCATCKEVDNEHFTNCECSICDYCGLNSDANECECTFCDDCFGNIDAKECECESKANEESAPIEDHSVTVVLGAMITWKCGDCDNKFEALPTMTMCDNCLSDNIKKDENNS